MYRGIDTDQLSQILDYLRPYKPELQNRATDQPWYELQQPQFRYSAAYSQPKIIFPDISKESRFALDESGAFIDMTVFAIPSTDRYLLGVLNSGVVLKFYSNISSQIREGYMRFKRQYVERIPIPTAGDGDRDNIADLVQSCISAKGYGSQVAEWETEINERVAWLYGLPTSSGQPRTEGNEGDEREPPAEADH
jgi:hypothetical protein